MKLEKLTDSINYTATVVKIKNIFPIEGMDRIASTEIFGNTVIISKETQIGDLGIFFLAESELSQEYLSYNNLYRNSELNKDKTKKGYVEENKRIKTAKFRGNISTGLWMPVESLNYIIDSKELKEGQEFNSIDGNLVCKKHIPVYQRHSNQTVKNDKIARKFDRLIPNQFRLHYDTESLARNIHKLEFDSIVSITSKIHGCQFTSSNVLVRRNLRWYEKLVKFLGIKVQETEFANIYSSRRVIKSVEVNSEKGNHFYGEDIWGTVNDELKGKIEPQITLYGEIAGYLSTGASIQGQYDYGCSPFKHKVYIYRITSTNPEGTVIEFSWQQVKDYCRKYDLNHVPEYYYGKIEALYKQEISSEINSEWRENLLQFLMKSLNLEKDCEFCANKVPAEGIVVRPDGGQAFKLKAKRFLLKESESLDKEEVNIDE